mmetsp:Transcript_12601/g.29247  ORF Transcript_12601/g.29247 Transcript_12601/m.29247 type:complete len:318 (-) Transcript_12601:1495-2448(-)
MVHSYPVHCAVLGGSLSLLKWLVDEHCCPLRSIRISGKTRDSSGSFTPILTSRGRSLLGIAMEKENVEIIQYLVVEKGMPLAGEKELNMMRIIQILDKVLRMIPSPSGDPPQQQLVPVQSPPPAQREQLQHRIETVGVVTSVNGVSASAARRVTSAPATTQAPLPALPPPIPSPAQPQSTPTQSQSAPSQSTPSTPSRPTRTQSTPSRQESWVSSSRNTEMEETGRDDESGGSVDDPVRKFRECPVYGICLILTRVIPRSVSFVSPIASIAWSHLVVTRFAASNAAQTSQDAPCALWTVHLSVFTNHRRFEFMMRRQ